MGATARLRWLARVETKGKKRSQVKRNTRQKRQGAETPPRKRTRTTEERQTEGKGKQGPLEQWLSGGSSSGPRQEEREDVPGTSAGKQDGASAPTQSSTHERREGTGNREEEKGRRASNKRKLNQKDRNGKEELATNIGKEETDHGTRINSLARWLQRKKRPAETPPDELTTNYVTTTDGNDGDKRLKTQTVNRTEEEEIHLTREKEEHPRKKGRGGDATKEGVG